MGEYTVLDKVKAGLTELDPRIHFKANTTAIIFILLYTVGRWVVEAMYVMQYS